MGVNSEFCYCLKQISEKHGKMSGPSNKTDDVDGQFKLNSKSDHVSIALFVAMEVVVGGFKEAGTLKYKGIFPTERKSVHVNWQIKIFSFSVSMGDTAMAR